MKLFILIHLLFAAISPSHAQSVSELQFPVVLYGRAVTEKDVKSNSWVWCNPNENKPNQIKKWGAKYTFAYVNAGAWESWWEKVPGDKFAKNWASKNPSAIGKSYPDWPDEKWLDIRTQAVRDYITLQIDNAKTRGFDGIDFDNLNLDQQNTGFVTDKDKGITWDHQKNYISWLTNTCRERKLLVSMRHVKKPHEIESKFQPNVWLIESAFEDKYWKDYKDLSGIYRIDVISLEYSKLPDPVKSFGWVIRANRALSVNQQTIKF